MTEIKIQSGCWWRWDKKRKGTKNLITAKLYCKALQYRALKKARKTVANGWEEKAKVQTTTKYNVMHRLQQVPKGKNRLRVNGNKLKNAY